MTTTNPLRAPKVIARIREFVVIEGANRPGKPSNLEIQTLLLKEFQLFATPNKIAGVLHREGIGRGGASNNTPSVWTEDRRQLLRDAIVTETVWQKIADIVGVTVIAANDQAKKMGLRKRPHEGQKITLSSLSPALYPSSEQRAAASQRKANLASAVARRPVVVTTLTPFPVAYRPMPIDFRAPHPIPASASSTPRYGRVVECCWPLGEPGARDFRFCDDPSTPGRPYCEDHAKIAYVRVRDRRKDVLAD